MDVRPELSRKVILSELPPRGLELQLVPTERERALLAERLDILSLDRLEATLRISGERDSELFLVQGEVEATLVQHCVVTMEPVTTPIAFSFSRQLTTREPEGGQSTVIDPEAEDEPDYVADGIADVGEILTEELILALPPYPRTTEAAVPLAVSTGRDDHPFKVLGSLLGRTS